MNIIKKTSTVHTTYKAGRPLKYIVLHYTAGTSSKSGAARGVAGYFGNPKNRFASADFIVDDAEIVQYNPDIRNRYCASVGGKKYSVKYSKESGTHYGICTNSNSISIEMCSNKKNKSSLGATDRDWYLTDATVKNALELTKYLMKTYNIPKENVIMHHNVTGKLCPQPWCIDNNALSNWYKFKAQLSDSAVNVDYKVKVTEPTGLNCRSGAGANFGIVTFYPDGTILHITKENYGWGYTGQGWINLSYTQKITEEEIDMTKAEVQKMIDDSVKKALAGADTEVSSWAVKEYDEAKKLGITDGTRPQGYATREQVALMVLRGINKLPSQK